MLLHRPLLAVLVAQAHDEALGRAPLAAGEAAVAVAIEALDQLGAYVRRQSVMTLPLHALALHGRDRTGRGRQLIGERGGRATGEEETDEEHDSLHALPTREPRGG